MDYCEKKLEKINGICLEKRGLLECLSAKSVFGALLQKKRQNNLKAVSRKLEAMPKGAKISDGAKCDKRLRKICGSARHEGARSGERDSFCC